MIIELAPLRINPVANAHGVEFRAWPFLGITYMASMWRWWGWAHFFKCFSAESYLRYGGNEVCVRMPWGSIYIKVKP